MKDGLMQRRLQIAGPGTHRLSRPVAAGSCQADRADGTEMGATVSQTARSVAMILGDLTGNAPMSDEQFGFFKALARDHAGIVIADFKRNMVARRVRTRLKALVIRDLEEYCAYLRGPKGKRELQPLINALTTNKTEFFREAHHFEHLSREALHLFKTSRGGQLKQLRVWSAGCSTGEEPYSIAMTLQEATTGGTAPDYRILATDIDTNVLAFARQGSYRKSDVTAISPALRAAYLQPDNAGERTFGISPAIKSRISFQHLNLHETWPMKGPFDIIFCRNVVIYFDKATQRRLFDRMADILAEDGFLYCGHSESLYGVSTRFRSMGQSIYQRIA